MARALMGHLGTSHDHLLALEVARLRRRVAELEDELAQAREHRSDAVDTVDAVDTFDVELHRLAESPQPALA